MITMNRIRNDSLMLKLSASAAPSHMNTISAPETPQNDETAKASSLVR